jgi:hypothetical protein
MDNKHIASFPTLPDPTYNIQRRSRVLPRDLLSGNIAGVAEMLLGDKNTKISGTDKRIIISDGTNERVWIGNLS